MSEVEGKDPRLESVAIFVDYDNVFWTLRNIYGHDPDDTDPQKNLFEKLWSVYGRDTVRMFRAYADFERLNCNLTSLQKKRIGIRHVYSKDASSPYRKNSSDIEMCLDAIESLTMSPEISCYVFVTCDSDIIPLLSRLMYKGKRVELYYLPPASPTHVDIGSYAHKAENIESTLGISVPSFDAKSYAVEALRCIRNWHGRNKSSDKYLGKKFLQERLFGEDLKLPLNNASDLIDYLANQELIDEVKKEQSSGREVTTIVLSPKGESVLNGDVCV